MFPMLQTIQHLEDYHQDIHIPDSTQNRATRSAEECLRRRAPGVAVVPFRYCTHVVGTKLLQARANNTMGNTTRSGVAFVLSRAELHRKALVLKCVGAGTPLFHLSQICGLTQSCEYCWEDVFTASAVNVCGTLASSVTSVNLLSQCAL